MKRLTVLVLFVLCVVTARSPGQIASAPAGSPSSMKAEKPAKAKAKNKDQKKDDKASGKNLLGLGADPRFNLQSDKLTVLITKGENQSLEKAIAEGNVGLIRDRPAANGGPPTRAVGRSDKATYTAATGEVELMGTPRVQEGPNLHVATSPDTVMIISQNSQLRTHGPSRTEIVQQPNDEKKGQASPSPTSAVQVSPAPSLPKP